MPRNHSEKDPYPAHALTQNKELNEYIASWYQAHWSPVAQLRPLDRTAEETEQQRNHYRRHLAAFGNGSQKEWEEAWATIYPGDQVYISGHQLRDLYYAAQSK